MTESAGPMLDLEISRRVLGEEPLRIPAYSTDDAAANLLLWRLAQTGVAFKIQELEGRHYCILWRGAEGPEPARGVGELRKPALRHQPGGARSLSGRIRVRSCAPTPRTGRLTPPPPTFAASLGRVR